MEQEIIRNAVDYQILINIGISIFGVLLSSVIGFLYKRLSEVSQENIRLSEKINKLNVDMPTHYVNKVDFQYMIDALFAKLDKIDQKLDKKIDKRDAVK